MPSLSEFLNEQAAKHDSVAAAKKRDREEWVAAVDRLISEMETWLKQADQHGILEVDRKTYEKREESIGHYEVEGLQIRLGAREVNVIPIARSIVAASYLQSAQKPQGRVDITDGSFRYHLYRLMDEPDGRWVMIPEKGGPGRYDQSSFEEAVRKLLE